MDGHAAQGGPLFLFVWRSLYGALSDTENDQNANSLRGLPFDVARESYAKSVQAGLIEESMLGGARFERNLASLEGLSLGPWARRG